MSTTRYPAPESESLLSSITGYFTPEVIRSASSMTGESESSTRQALHGAAPTVLKGMTDMASTPEGAGNLAGMIRDGGYGGLTENPISLFRGGTASSYMFSSGQKLLGNIFGSRTSSVVELFGRSSGVSASAAGKFLALTTPLTLGVLSKRLAASKLGPAGAGDMLLGQKAEIAAAVPQGLSRALESGPRLVSTTVDRDTAIKAPTHIEHHAEAEPALERKRSGLGWLPLLLLAVGVGILLISLLGRPRVPRVADVATQGASLAHNALSSITLPGGTSLTVPQGSINYNLARFLGDASETTVPKTFVFDHLNFESATTQLTPDSNTTVNGLAQILNAYPHAQIQLVGHTDNTGTHDANQSLSLDRANAVRAMLVQHGIAADRIATQGYGQDRPVAPNDTEEGRAKNRRIELTVTQK